MAIVSFDPNLEGNEENVRGHFVIVLKFLDLSSEPGKYIKKSKTKINENRVF